MTILAKPFIEGVTIVTTEMEIKVLQSSSLTTSESGSILLGSTILPECFYWSMDEVAKWVENIGFKEYKVASYSNQLASYNNQLANSILWFS